MPQPAAGDAGPPLPVGLTAAQHRAVTADDPLLCVLAGAGAGKTRVLTLRVARRVEDGSATADHVLVCTFSRKAADELRRRLWALDVDGEVRAGTFHRIALSLLRQQRADRGLGPPSVLSDRRGVLATLMLPRDGGPAAGRRDGSGNRGQSRGAPAGRPGAGGAPAGGRRDPVVAQLETEIGWAKARLVGPADYAQVASDMGRRPRPGVAAVAKLYDRYEVERRRLGLVDLDDLLLACGDMLAEDRGFADAVRWRFRHLFVDEMQDVNPAQFRLLVSLLGDEPDLFVVGDPHQSVYGWNGADPSLLDRLPALLPGTRVLRLDENHRCSPQVVGVAAAALGLPPDQAPTSSRPDGALPEVAGHETDLDEADWVARRVWVARRPGWRWSDVAVLARTNAQLVPVADALRRQRIPFHLAGGELGPASDVGRSAGAGPRGGSRRGGGPAPAALGALPVAVVVPDDDLGPVADGDDIPDDRGGWAPDRADGPEGGERGPEGGEHGDVGAGDPGAPAGAVGEQAGGVVLTTFHRAKGLQWPCVFVIGVSDGLVPIASARTPAARAEERRLLYVALTRAQDQLTCSWARHREVGEPGAPRAPSPWLAAVDAARRAMAAAAEPESGAEVTARLAALRALLPADGTGRG